MSWVEKIINFSIDPICFGNSKNKTLKRILNYMYIQISWIINIQTGLVFWCNDHFVAQSS